MNKKSKYAINGAIGGTLAFGIANCLSQYADYRDSVKSFDWERLLGSLLKGAIAGGAIGLVIGAIRDHFNALEKPRDTSSELLDIVQQNRLTKRHPEYINGRSKVDAINDLLCAQFGDVLMQRPVDYGSVDKGTALIDNSDFDMAALFKPGAFSSTGEMINSVHDHLKENKHLLGNATVRMQGKSVGLAIKDGDTTAKFDVVPCRITKIRGNKTSGYLHKRETTLLGTKKSFTKTNIPLLKAQTLSPTQQKMVVALKCWKKNKRLRLKGNLIEALVREAYAYNRGKIPRAFAEKIIMVWRYIADNLQTVVIRSVENTNNILTRMSDANKRAIIQASRAAVADYEYQPNSIVEAIGSKA